MTGFVVPISLLKISNHRNIAAITIPCSPQFNLFFGDNGAGKTAVLEAIYYLSCGKSFRTNHLERMILGDLSELTIFSQLTNGDQLGLQKSRSGESTIRYNEKTISSITQLSQSIPVQFIGTASHRILLDGPKARRQFLDWGLFYTCPHFYPQWREYQKLLSQRNAALKARAPMDELTTWNHMVAATGEALNKLRVNYINEFAPYFTKIASVLLRDIHIDFSYSQGWNSDCSLLESFNRNVSRETLFGYSLYGPHRADLTISINDIPAQDVLSQGQQKLLSYALRLAQGLHSQQCTTKSPIYLIDDMPSELDPEKQFLVASILRNINAQVFLTAISADDLLGFINPHESNMMFHVKHGNIEIVGSELLEKADNTLNSADRTITPFIIHSC